MAKYKNDDIVVAAALRTPIGTLNGSMSSLKASSLGSKLIESLLKSTEIQTKDISEVILGQALTAGSKISISYTFTVQALLIDMIFLPKNLQAFGKTSYECF